MPHCPLTRYVNLRVAHAPGMRGTFSPPPRFSDPDMHHGTCVTHVPWCMRESLTSSFLWSRWRGKRSRHSRCMRIPQLYVSGKRPMFRLAAAVKATSWMPTAVSEHKRNCKTLYPARSVWHAVPISRVFCCLAATLSPSNVITCCVTRQTAMG